MDDHAAQTWLAGFEVGETKQQLRARRNRHSRHETLEPRILLTATGNTDANDLEANDQEEEVAELLFATDLSSDNITVDTGSFELGSLTDFSPIPYLPLTVTGPLTIEEGETYALQLPSSDTALGEIVSWRIDWGMVRSRRCPAIAARRRTFFRRPEFLHNPGRGYGHGRYVRRR